MDATLKQLINELVACSQEIARLNVRVAELEAQVNGPTVHAD